MYYADLNRDPNARLGTDWARDPAGRDRAIATLLRLREALATGESAPPPRTDGNLVLGTWNIREFDSEKWGSRLPEAHLYIAEILDRFDLVAVQEVRADLSALDRVRARLGPSWKYLVSDVTEGAAGNGERLAYLYDTRKVRFLDIAGELVLPPIRSKSGVVPAQQVARSPLMAAFQVGWTKLMLATVHIIYGDDTAEPAARVDEIRQVAEFLRKRTETETEPVRNVVVLGDFNIFTDGDATLDALTNPKYGDFTVPDELRSVPGSNVAKDKKYDQIAFRTREGRFQYNGRAGVFDFFEHVFRLEDEATYRPYIDSYIAAQAAAGAKSPKPPKNAKTATTQYRDWRTHQMSDHLPMWVELKVDFSDEYLRELQTQEG